MEGYIVDGLVHAVPEGSGQVSLVLQEPQHCESCQGNWVGLKRSMVPTKKILIIFTSLIVFLHKNVVVIVTFSSNDIGFRQWTSPFCLFKTFKNALNFCIMQMI